MAATHTQFVPHLTMSAVTTIMNAAPRVAMIMLNRPPVNAMDTGLLTQLAEAVRAVEKEKANEGWGLVLSSAAHATSPVFSAGLDLGEMYNQPRERINKFWFALQDVFLALYGSKLATVCAINGTSPAGGCFLATLCDYRVAVNDQPKAVIGLNEAKFGLVAPSWFADPLKVAVGARKAERMLQLGELIPLKDAHACGLIDELVPQAQVVTVALERAAQWASNGPANARHLSKLTTRAEVMHKLQADREGDTKLFVDRVSVPAVQAALEKYLASLKKR
jgi:3,2-trans-enoyl-CoA isomerase